MTPAAAIPKPGEVLTGVPCALVLRPCARTLISFRLEAEPFLDARLNTSPGFDPKAPPLPYDVTVVRSPADGVSFSVSATFPKDPPVLVLTSLPVHADLAPLVAIAACQGLIDIDFCIYDLRQPPQHQPPHILRSIPALGTLRDPGGPFATRLQHTEARHWDDPRAKHFRPPPPEPEASGDQPPGGSADPAGG